MARTYPGTGRSSRMSRKGGTSGKGRKHRPSRKGGLKKENTRGGSRSY